jgi:CYTH domain
LTEIELKLAAPGDLPVLKQALEDVGKRSSTTASLLTSTYYDSPDLKLWQHRLTLRVRKQGAQHVQTVQAGDFIGPDLISRGEWEDVIAGDQPDLDAPQTGGRPRTEAQKARASAEARKAVLAWKSSVDAVLPEPIDRPSCILMAVVGAVPNRQLASLSVLAANIRQSVPAA